MGAVTAAVGDDAWLVDDGAGVWGLAQLVADLCEARKGVRTLISQLHLRDEELFNAGEHASTPPRLSAACLAEMGRAGVSRGTAVVVDDRERMAVHPWLGWPRPVLAEAGGDRIEIGYGSAELRRQVIGDSSPGARVRHVCRLGALFVQAPTAQGNAVLLPVPEGQPAEEAFLAAAGRAETADDDAELSAWQDAERDPRGREPGSEPVGRHQSGGTVSRTVIRLRDGSAARTVRLVEDDLPCRERYAGMWRQLEQLFAASARNGLPVRWEAADHGA